MSAAPDASCNVSGIEDLCSRRDELHREIVADEEEKAKLQNEIRMLTDRLAKLNESLAQKIASRAEFDRTIAETEAAYTKVRVTLKSGILGDLGMSGNSGKVREEAQKSGKRQGICVVREI